jgi:hypothetical protein
MRGTTPQLPQYAFMAWCSVKKRSTGTTLPLPLHIPLRRMVKMRNTNIYKILDGNLKNHSKDLGVDIRTNAKEMGWRCVD